MMNILNFYEAGRARSGVAYMPVLGAMGIRVTFSTRRGNSKISKSDGSSEYLYINTKQVDYISTGNKFEGSTSVFNGYTGDVKITFLQGLNDVYSWSFFSATDKYGVNIQNLKSFLSQFPNLYSFLIDLSSSNNTTPNVIKGDLCDIPISIRKVLINGLGGNYSFSSNLFLNLNSFSPSSKLEYFNLDTRLFYSQLLVVSGNLANIPQTCSVFTVHSVAAGSSITYTAGKVWASSFDTLSIPLTLTTTELDSLLADMANSITTKVGAGVISLGGYRSSTSDAAVASLQAKGFTVNVQRVLNNVSNADSALIRLDFQNNFDVYSNSGMNIIPGGTSNQPTFALSGRKAGEYCAVFNGSQSLKTTTNLPINSDKVTVAFWMKTTQTTTSIIAELSSDYAQNSAFEIPLVGGKVGMYDHGISPTGYNVAETNAVNNNVWRSVIVVTDRSLGINQSKIYINGILGSVQNNSFVTDIIGNFINSIFFIGQKAGSSLGFNGSLTKLKMYNYPFTPSEVSNLYNSEL